MAELRYTELKFEGKIYNEQWKIDEILIKNKFNWMVNAEIKNARLEIFENTLVWNAGIWYNGSWYFGVWRDGEWRYGTWQNGVWYNGVWRDGTFKSGIIYKGKFFKGKIESGEIRGGQFIDVQIDPKVVEYTDDEYQVKKEEEKKQTQVATATAEPTTVPQTNVVKVHSTQPPSQQPVAQPKIQQEKKEYKNMKKIKTFESFSNNSEFVEFKVGDIVRLKKFTITGRDIPRIKDECFRIDKINSNYDDHGQKSEDRLDGKYHLILIGNENDSVTTWKNSTDIELAPEIIQQMNKKEYENKNMKKIKTFGKFVESVGEYEDSFVKVNRDETELETSDRPNLGKLKQKPGKIVIETPSKTDAYNAKMRLGGDIIQEPGFSDKQIHTVKDTK